MWQSSCQRFRWLSLILLSTSISETAWAEWFVAADVTTLETKMNFVSTNLEHELEPARVKFGYMGEIVGWEIRVHDDTKDTTSGAGFDWELENQDTIGAFVRVAPRSRVAYFSIGVLRTDSKFRSLQSPTVVDREMITFVGASLGAQYRLTDNLGITLEYSYYDGKHRLPSYVVCVPPSSGECDRPNVRYQGFGAGLQFTF